MANEVKIKLTIDGKQAIATMDKAQLELSETQQKGEQTRSTFQSIRDTAVGNYIAQGFQQAVASIKQVISESQELYKTQVESEAKVEQLVKTTQRAAGFSAEQLKEQASGLQSVTTFGDEAILDLQSKLLTFKSIQGDIFQRTQEIALDTATIFGNTSTAALQLGKVLEDPAGQLSSLRRVGISFNEEQEKVIKNLDESGRKAEAQAKILDILEGQLGGVSEAMARTSTGALQQYENRVGDLQEVMGGWITDIRVQALPTMNSLLDSVFEWIQTPTIEKIEAERANLNTLVSEYRLANTSSERRAEIMRTLQDQYTDFIENINIETASNAELRDVLRDTNREYENRIAVASEAQKLEGIQEQVTELENLKGRQRQLFSETLFEINRQFGVNVETSGKTIQQVIDDTNQALNELRDSNQIGDTEGQGLLRNLNYQAQIYEERVGTLNYRQDELQTQIRETVDLLQQQGIPQERIIELTSQYIDDITRFPNLERQYRNSLEDLLTSNEALTQTQQERAQSLVDILGLNGKLLPQQAEFIGLTEKENTKTEESVGLQEQLARKRAEYEDAINNAEYNSEADIQELQNMQKRIEELQKLLEKRRQYEREGMGLTEPGIGRKDIETETFGTQPATQQDDTSKELALNSILQERANILANVANQHQSTTAIALEGISTQTKFQATLQGYFQENYKALGRNINQAVLYADSVEEAGARILEQIANEIIMRYVLAGLKTAGFSGPAAFITAGVLSALAVKLGRELVNSIAGKEEGGLVSGGEQIIRINEAGEEYVINADSTKAAPDVLETINTSPNAAKQLNNIVTGKAPVQGVQRFAKGGSFITDGPELIMVGDNPGGRERVSVTPQNNIPSGPGGDNVQQQPPVVNVNVSLENEISARKINDALTEFTEIENLVGN